MRPVRQAVELTVDPNLETFSGSVAIELEVREATSLLWLNAIGLKVTSASLGPAGAMRPATVVAGGDDFVGFATKTPLAPGPARLAVSFEGAVSRRDEEGIFAVKEDGAWYLFTQFEALAARKAFPCFDEPSYKIPWQVTLRVPHGLVALSNSPIVSTASDGGRDVVRYAPTPPLPSYLVAFTVGPFDLVDVGPAGRNSTPTRLVVPRGRAADTAWARESTPRILALLEDYFDRPYPYAKLDQVAIPGVGLAMEHPGLVTYGQSAMVQRPAEETIASRRGWASVCAHELAHQWFGDLVTMAWWDDTWLNESFASWLGEKVTDQFRPDWGVAVERASDRSRALEADSFATARRIRQPITSKDDIYNAFDGVTYGKGQAVLEMLEAWLGEDAFRRGVKRYVERHAWGNATAADFVRALSAAADRDVCPVLGSFLDQTGAPVVSAAVRCDGVPRLVVSQRPYRALGSPAESKLWNLPLCARVSGRESPACTVLSAASGEIPLGAGACPEWSFPNAAGAGYYRGVASAAQARRVIEGGYLSATERVTLAGDLAALVSSGDVSAADALELAPLLARDTNRQVVSESTRIVRGLEPLVPEPQVAAFRRVVRAAYGERARALGWSASPGTAKTSACSDGRWSAPPRRSAGTQSSSARLSPGSAAGWRTRQPSIPIWSGTPSRPRPGPATARSFARLVGEAVQTTDRERRERILGGLGGVRDPELVRQVLALTLDARIDARESVWVLWALGSQRETRRDAFDFLKANYDALLARLPQGEMSPVLYLPWVGASLCAPDTRQEIGTFFEKRSVSVTGASRVLAQVLESVDQCVARKAAQQAGLVAYLESRPED